MDALTIAGIGSSGSGSRVALSPSSLPSELLVRNLSQYSLSTIFVELVPTLKIAAARAETN